MGGSHGHHFVYGRLDQHGTQSWARIGVSDEDVYVAPHELRMGVPDCLVSDMHRVAPKTRMDLFGEDGHRDWAAAIDSRQTNRVLDNP